MFASDKASVNYIRTNICTIITAVLIKWLFLRPTKRKCPFRTKNDTTNNYPGRQYFCKHYSHLHNHYLWFAYPSD